MTSPFEHRLNLTQRQLFLQYVAQTSDFPLALEIIKAEGLYLYGSKGEQYMDLISGIGVSNIGHRHPAVLKAITEQLDKYLHLMVYGEYVQAPQVLLSQKLASLLPSTLQSIYFVNSGSEAVEGAMKLAKRYTKRSQVLSCVNAYHGSTQGALSIGGNEKLKRNFRPLLPDTDRLVFGKIEDLSKITEKTAAVFIETVQGEAGVRTATKDYFKQLRQLCSETGTLLVLDEIQCGYGRTGTFWAFEQYDLVPDILLCAKGMGGGMPLGAFISSTEIMSVLRNNPVLGHITTFGGHPVSCAASLATLNVLIEEQLIQTVFEKENLFTSLLKHPKIKEIRSSGLMMAVEFDSFVSMKHIIDRGIEKGVITDWFLFCDNSMRIAPPLTISQEEIHKACQILLEAIDIN